MSKETLKKFLKFMEKWHYEDFNAFENHFNKLISMKSKEQLTNENEALKDSIAVILAQKKNVNNQLDQLKQQLEEKDKEIEEKMMSFEKRCQEYYKSDEFKRDFAVQELEKVKELLLIESKNNPIIYDVNDDTVGGALDREKVFEIIEQQISKIKGDGNEK